MAVTPQTGTGQCSIGPTSSKTTDLTSSRLQPFNLSQYSASFPTHADIFLKIQDLKSTFVNPQRGKVQHSLIKGYKHIWFYAQ